MFQKFVKMSRMATVLDHFDFLTSKGLKAIPLFRGTKKPMYRGWNVRWDRHFCRSILLKNPNCNLGLLLGDVIDVEGDTESANKLLANLIGDYPHPSYTSSKSVHHLFNNPGDLRILKFKNIEFRGHGHQSVLPPSKHEDGTIYRWTENTKFPIPNMPKKLLNFFYKVRDKKDTILKPNHMPIHCIYCKNVFYLHKKRFELELAVFKDLCQKWCCRNCRALDIREACRIKRRYV